MIRIDYKIVENHVNTTWVSEDGDSHSLMGRLVFTKEQFKVFEGTPMAGVYFEEKK